MEKYGINSYLLKCPCRYLLNLEKQFSWKGSSIHKTLVVTSLHFLLYIKNFFYSKSDKTRNDFPTRNSSILYCTPTTPVSCTSRPNIEQISSLNLSKYSSRGSGLCSIIHAQIPKWKNYLSHRNTPGVLYPGSSDVSTFFQSPIHRSRTPGYMVTGEMEMRAYYSVPVSDPKWT